MKSNTNSLITTKNMLRAISIIYSLWIFISPYKSPYFMVWNLFLAWIPLEIIDLIIRINNSFKAKNVFVINYILWILWILFYPNSPYMVTDFIHIIGNKYVLSRPIHPNYAITNRIMFNDNFKIWLDFVNIAIGVWLGYIVGFIALNKAHKTFFRKLGFAKSWLIVFLINIISGYAIYLGRFIRWNSWDIITKPKNIFIILLNNINRKSFYFTILFGGFMFILYLIHYAITINNKLVEGED
ncbi:hypothetical protein C1I91_27545 [Clostridium manihotivorum]|uniref:DUF1361 domain-containing protein n=2 Tax=Clostridium manihotivorum TaxID=2320868 RepID=A0A410E1B4_9CLOT|nr:hypothetical protein C1I91_27545 [Clostridium manihotivorum]